MKIQSQINRIAVFRALQLGDMLCAIPAIRALRRSFPQAHITLLGLPWAKLLITRFPEYFDDFIHFPGYPHLPEQEYSAAAYAAFVQQARNEAFDLVLQMQGNGTIVNDMLMDIHPKILAGFYNQNCITTNPHAMWYPEGRPEIHRHLALMEYLGLPSVGDYLEFPFYPGDRLDFEDMQFPYDPGTYVCLHPGSRGYRRQWPPAFFAMMADYIYSKGFHIVITGTNDEADITKEVAVRMKAPVLNLTGKTTLGSAAILIREAKMLFSNCTGVSHIAAAVRTPSVVISMDGQADRWAPLNKSLHKTVDWSGSHELAPVFEYVDAQLAFENILNALAERAEDSAKA